MMDQRVGQLLHRLGKRTGHDHPQGGRQEDEEDRGRDQGEQDGRAITGLAAPVIEKKSIYVVGTELIGNANALHKRN